MNREVEELEARNNAKKDHAFDRWMNEPITRMTLSMIPAGEHPGALRVLLRTAFDLGFGVGVAEILNDVLERVLKDKANRRDQ